MKKWILLLVIAALVCWVPGQALSYGPTPIDTYVSTLDTPTFLSPGFPVLTDYGTVTVYRNSTTSAVVGINLIDGFAFAENNYSAFLNVAGTATATAETDFGYTWYTPEPKSNNAIGAFDIATMPNPHVAGLTFVRIELTATDTTFWASAADVLEPNNFDFDAGAFLKYNSANNFSTSSCPVGYVGEAAVPLPGAVLLLGAGLCRLTAYARRKRQV